MTLCVHSARNSEAACELLTPVPLLERGIPFRIPGVASPGCKPDPVAIGLNQQRLGLVGAVGPVPVAQRIDMHTTNSETDEVALGLPHEGRITPAKGLEVGEQMDVDDGVV